jgi:hypothetical protein
MQTCKTCRHWSEEPFSLARRFGEGFRYCQRINFAYQQAWPRPTPPLATLQDDGGDDASLVTLADFGCVLHEVHAVTVREDDGA